MEIITELYVIMRSKDVFSFSKLRFFICSSVWIVPFSLAFFAHSHTLNIRELDSALMSSSTTPALALPSEEYDQRMKSNPYQHQNQSLLHGNVAILWDIENCPVPSDVRPEDVAGNIRMALRVHLVIDGAVTMFSAYGDFSAFPRRLREGCQRTGVKLIDVPNGRKDAADKAILVDMFLFALDNPPPSSIMLISGGVDFAPALHILGQRGYIVVLVIPSGTGVSSALSNAGRFVWDWPSVARGEGFVTPVKSLREATALLRGCQVNDVAEGQIEEESIVYRGQRKTVCLLNSKNDYYVGPTTPTVILARLENKGKATQEDSSASDVMDGAAGSSDELSDEERMATQENGDKSEGGAKSNFESVDNRANGGRLRRRFFTLALLFYVFLVVLHSAGIIEINIETTNK